MPEVDIAIVGAGPTGLYAAYYAGFRGLSVAIIDTLPEPGGQVTAMYPLGPRPGVAAMVAMITYGDTCCLGLNVDPQCFPDADALERALREGFDEVLALAETDRRVQR